MTATSFSHKPNVSEFPSFHAILLEPFFLIATCLFWLVFLPLTGLFCAGVAIYDRLAAAYTGQISLHGLRHHPSANPLVLRKKALPVDREKISSRRASHVAQA